MKIRIIQDDEQYKHYMEWLDRLIVLDPDPRSEVGQVLGTLAVLIKDYEDEHWKAGDIATTKE